MAVLADICRIDVRGVFARGVSAIVTTEAVTGNVRVVENSGKPERAGMAVVTLVTGDNMPRWFAGRLAAVVASAAAARYFGVIHIGDRTPRRSRMAARAKRRRCDVARRPHRREHGADLGMASRASRTGALENAAGMTPVATDILVCTIEIKTGSEMIKRFLCRRRGSEK